MREKLTSIIHFEGWLVDVDQQLQDYFTQKGSTLHPLHPTYMIGSSQQAGTYEEEYIIKHRFLTPVHFSVSWQDQGDKVYIRKG